MSHLAQLHYVLGKAPSTATIRQYPDDFQVSEQLSFSPSGEGQHVYLFIEKRNLNTEDIAKQLAKFVGVRQVDVGYAGLKDRKAVTRQWFSIDLAGKAEPNWHDLNSDNVVVIEVVRHSRKLKRGAVRYNYFQITLRHFEGDAKELNQRFELIQLKGVPNYFGEQRFGHNDANLKQAEKLFLQVSHSGRKKHINRHLRGIYLSAVRAYIFNHVLSQRVEDKTWNQPVDGDVFMLDGSHSIFSVDTIDDEIIRRINEFDIHPTGPMWGRGLSLASGEVLAIETKILQPHQAWCDILENAGMKQERRALRVRIVDLNCERVDSNLILRFALPSGSYATSVLRELVCYS